jgi:hypothetical protein
VHLPFPPDGGVVLADGRSILYGELIVLNSGANINFNPFSHEHRPTGAKKNSFGRLYATPSSLLPVLEDD